LDPNQKFDANLSVENVLNILQSWSDESEELREMNEFVNKLIGELKMRKKSCTREELSFNDILREVGSLVELENREGITQELLSAVKEDLKVGL
jgi:hypothetical protein